MSSYSAKLTAIFLVALLGFASASEWKKPKWHKHKHYDTETSVHGAGGARAGSKKSPGKAYASSLDLGTAFSSDHFSGVNTADLSDTGAKVEYAAAGAGGNTMAFAVNNHGYVEGKSGTMSESAEAGVYFPDIDAFAAADGLFATDAKGRLTFSQGGQESYAAVDDQGFATSGSDAGTRSYEAKTAADLFLGGLGTELASFQGLLRLTEEGFVPIGELAAKVAPELPLPNGN